MQNISWTHKYEKNWHWPHDIWFDQVTMRLNSILRCIAMHQNSTAHNKVCFSSIMRQYKQSDTTVSQPFLLPWILHVYLIVELMRNLILVWIFRKADDPDVIWTRNLLIWSQTRYRCATRSLCYGRIHPPKHDIIHILERWWLTVGVYACEHLRSHALNPPCLDSTHCEYTINH